MHIIDSLVMTRTHKARLPLLSFLYYLLLYGSLPIIAQSNSTASSDTRTKWISSPFENKVFIENKGQFDAELLSDKIKFGINSMGMQTYFTSSGMTYLFNVSESSGNKSLNGKEKDQELQEDEVEERKRDAKVYIKQIHMQWLNANPNAKLISENGVPEYYTYSDANNLQTYKASACKKIVYKDLYPNIDVEYIFHEKEGIKYSLLLHPGANVSSIKMKYSGVEKIYSDNKGNIHLVTPIGDIIDHTPITFYEVSRSAITSAFEVSDGIVSFRLSNYDKNKTIVIDPWTTVPAFTTNRAYDINYDLKGNVYIHGSFGPFQLSKYNNAGVLLWTYTCPNFFGNNTWWTYADFALDEVTGTSYIVEGFDKSRILKVNTLGVQIGMYPGTISTRMNEMWRCEYNRCLNKIVIGSGGTVGTYQAAMLDTSMTTIVPVNILGISLAAHDVSLLAIDPNSADCYMLTAWRVSDTLANNTILKCPIPGLIPTTWTVKSGHTFQEGMVMMTRAPAMSAGACGFNGMACGQRFLYSYDGVVLKKWDKSNGAFLGQVNTGGTMFVSGGLSVDECDNVYAGANNVIKEYNSSLVQIGTFNLPNTCYDLKLGLNNKLYGCGISFVTEIDVPPSGQAINLTSVPSSGCACNGTATANPACINPSGYNYSWSPGGQTTQTAIGLCPGNYTVQVTTFCFKTQTASISVTGTAGSLSVTSNQTNIKCSGTTGTASVFVSGGTPPYVYLWSNGHTGATASGLTAGSYMCTVTDANSCTSTQVFNITKDPAPFTIYPDQTNIGCQKNGSIALTVISGSAPYTYNWSNGSANDTISSIAPGGYTVTVSDASGCSSTRTFLITSSSPLDANFISPPTACVGSLVNFINTGVSAHPTYTSNWVISTILPTNVSGTSPDFSYSFLSAGTYTISHTFYGGGCNNTINKTITIINCTGPSVIAIGNSVCQGSCATVTSSGTGGTGPYTYSWT